jgi:predicted MFS family arabinose efflux permease
MSAAGQKVIPEGWHRHFILLLMTGVYIVNYLDRQIVGILLPEIKAEFHLSDTQLGFIAGLGFAFVYSLLAIPLGVLADRANRRNLIAACLALFSVANLACGLVTNFLQLMVGRFVAALGETGTSPAINSLISDYYRPHERAHALSVYATGLSFGLLVAYFCGGWMDQHWGWRAAIMVSGVPGLILVVMLFLLVPEPARGLHDTGQHRSSPPFPTVLKYLFTQRSFMRLTLGSAMLTFNGNVVLSFMPAFLQRTHGMLPADRGIALALMSGIGGALGTYSAGVLASYMGKRRDIRWNMYVVALITLLQLPLLPLAYLSSSLTITIVALILPFALLAGYSGVTLATVANLVPIGLRAQALSIHGVVIGLFGVAFAPIATGWLSDILHDSFGFGEDSLRWSMLILSFSSMSLAVLGYWWTSLGLAEDVERVQKS